MAEKKRLYDILKADIQNKVKQMRASLTDKEREILDARFDYSKNAEVTQKRILEIEEKMLRRLKRP